MITIDDPPKADGDPIVALVTRLAAMPTAEENMMSTWCPPEYDDLKTWWTEAVLEARRITGKENASHSAARTSAGSTQP